MVKKVLALLFVKSYQYVHFSDRHTIHTKRRHRTCERCTNERPNTQAFNMKSDVLFENRNLYCVGMIYALHNMLHFSW